ncbi:MAG TPA: terminase small subunit [Rhodocyclaceae bacterium]|nr:terminase small subunit [Rhodocyclaceae bacterium]
MRGQETVADVFGVAPKTIVEWQEQGFPVALRGGPGVPSEYETADCIRWLVEREVRKVQGESPNDRLARVKADAIEMDNAERRGLLVRADAVEPRLRAAFVAAREMWIAEPKRLARAVLGLGEDEAEQLLQESFEAFLQRLATWQDADAEDEGDAIAEDEEEA